MIEALNEFKLRWTDSKKQKRNFRLVDFKQVT